MTHMKPMADSEGVFDSEEKSSASCRKCKTRNVMVRAWDSSCGSYTDYRYRCRSCNHVWWVDGSDS